MSPIRHLWPTVLVALLLPVAAPAAWNDRPAGAPSLESFPDRITGATSGTNTMVQDGRGRLFVGSDALLVYDGVSWSSHPIPDSYGITSLCFGPDHRLWTGAYNQIGYYTESPDGKFAFTSLLPELPADQRRIESVWGCGLVGTDVYFICQSKVLRWDGTNFTVWDFPNQTRLFAVRLGHELWFTHRESGLYRLTAEGPRLEYGPKDLPATPAFGLERDSGGLRIFSRDGLCHAGQPRQSLCSAEVVDFLRTRPVSSFLRLPDGNYAIGTLGGLGIMSADGRLLRALSPEDGLPSNAINTLFLDQERQLWIAQSTGGLTRADPTGAVSPFQRWGQANHASILRLVRAQDAFFAATDVGLFRLEDNAAGTAKFLPVEAMPALVRDVVANGDGLLLGRFGGLDYFDGKQLRTVLSTPSFAVWRILPSQKEPGVFFCVINQKIARLAQGPAGQWQRQDLGELPEPAENCYLDPQDNLWFDSAASGVWHFDTASRQISNIHPGDNPGLVTEPSQVTGHGPHVYFFTAREGFAAEVGSKAVQRMAGYPAVSALQCATSPDGRRLYVAFARKLAARTTYGVGRLELDEQGAVGGWTELQVPKLEAAGAPGTLLVTSEDGADTLWVGGSEGSVRLKPEELPAVRPPLPPWLQTFETSKRMRTAGPGPAYPFFGHHLLIRISSPEIDARPHLRFETRLGDGRGEWSEASSLSSFEFTNLTDGSYAFEARTVNDAGLVSEPVAYAFRILPPWYRTPWAYGGFAAAAAVGIFGYVRFHERRIRARNLQLESLVKIRTAELVKANAAKDEFLAGISHEIRNPMNGVIGIATIIDSSRFDPATQQQMAQLRHCATHLSGLLEDILDYSRLQAGAVDLNPQPFDRVEMIDSLVALTSAESAHYGIPLEMAVSPAVPRYLVGDIARLRQILLNYIVNALKYSGRGKVCLTIWGQQTLPDQIALTFAVSDDGPGISPEEQARLFTRFERGAAAQTQRVAGTGLGLALCKTLGEKMGGRLWVESEPGHGSTFYLAVTLPVASDPPARLNHAQGGDPQTGALHALVVDDEEYNRITLSGFLEEIGFRVTAAATGEEALAIARCQPLQAVFLDVNLPGLSGPEIARALRAMENLEPDLPIIATTAYTTEEKRRLCTAAGMSSFLTKPVSLEKIHAALTAATATQRATASFHPPGQEPPVDPLDNLRLLAQRKGVTLEAESALFLTELASETRLLAEAIKRREPATAGETAHRLAGRLAFVRATLEAQLAGEVEVGSMNELWDQADASASRLADLLPGLRDRIAAAR